MGVSTDGFDALYVARAPGLVRSVYARTGDLDRAHECVQEAFVRAWMRWSRIRDENPAAWVRTVAWRLAVSDWRARSRERLRLQKVAAREIVQPAPVDELVTVRRAIATLTPAQQTVIVLHYFEDLPIAEIADLAAMSVGTVKSHLHRARSSLRSALEDPPMETRSTRRGGKA